MHGSNNIVSLFIAGGWVMYPILALAMVMLTIIIERLTIIFLQKMKLKPAVFADKFMQSLEANGGDKMKTIEEMEELLKKGGVFAEIMGAIFHKYKDGTSKNMTPIEIKEWMTKGMEAQAGVEVPTLTAHLIALAVISNVATLAGLFGTVIGMIESFTSMANSPGGVKADEMAGGIAIALVATAGGLVVAIPSLVLYNWIKSHIEGFVVEIEEACMGISDILAE